MSTATRVPETITISGDELSADDAVTTLRRYGRWKLVKNSFIRFRYADGFTNARALALQLCLSFIPLIIAVVGLSSALHQEKFGQIITQTVDRGVARQATTATWCSKPRNTPTIKARPGASSRCGSVCSPRSSR